MFLRFLRKLLFFFFVNVNNSIWGLFNWKQALFLFFFWFWYLVADPTGS